MYEGPKHEINQFYGSTQATIVVMRCAVVFGLVRFLYHTLIVMMYFHSFVVCNAPFAYVVPDARVAVARNDGRLCFRFVDLGTNNCDDPFFGVSETHT